MIAESERSVRRPELSPAKQALLEKRLKGHKSDRATTNPSIPRRASSGPAPLSFGQQRLWFAHRLAPESPLYHLSISLRIQGNLDPNLLEKSLQTMVHRHESLRTRFLCVDGEPTQVVEPAPAVILTQVDLTGEYNGESRAAIARIIRRDVRQPFDLAAGALLRATLMRLSESEHVLLIAMHHIASDGWSMGIQARELMGAYAAFAAGSPPLLPPLAIQYSDYSCWYREWMQGETLREQLKWWRQQLHAAPDLLPLPADHPRPAVQTFRGRCRWKTFRAGLIEELRRLSRAEGATLYMTLLATFQVLLHRLTGQKDILIGSPVAGRNHPETEGLVGLFVNTLVMRAKLSGAMTFREFLKTVKESTLEACAHQDLPFEKLVEELQPERNSSHSPLIQVMFALQTALENISAPPGLSVAPFAEEEVDTGTANFDLTLYLEESSRDLNGVLEYNTDLFEEPTIERFLKYYETLLESVVGHPDRRISELEILTDAERHQLLIEWNDTQTDYPRDQTIAELFAAQATRHPDHIAVTFREQQLTYGELDKRANAVAGFLRSRGFGPNVLVAVCMERGPDLVIALLGILKAGAAYVSLDPGYPKERLAFLIADARAPLVLTKGNLGALFEPAGTKCQVIGLDDIWPLFLREGTAEPLAARPCEPTDLAYVSYTSGSTGTPKGVCIPQRAVARLVFNTNYISLEATDVMAQIANCGFDASTFEIWGALLHGARLAIIPQEAVLSPVSFARALTEQRITTLFVTTALFNQISREVPLAFATLKHVLFGGEAVNPAHVKQVLEHGAPQRLLHVYGPTETTTFATWHETRTVTPDGTIPIGRPISNTEAYVLDEYFQPVPIGVRGELFIGGDGLATGYLNRPELTAEKFVNHAFGREGTVRLYRTGDLVRRLADGSLEFLGRRDTQIKLRGYRIELGEIEAVLGQHPAVSECVVTATPDREGEKRLAAYAVLKQGTEVAAEDLRHHLRAKLPDFMVPPAIVLLEALPINGNGKVDRQALPAAGEISREPNQKFVAPRTDVERQLAAIWEELLATHPVGAEDNFFELGGHSLLTVRLLARIEKTFGVSLPVATVFQSPILAHLASAVQEAKADHARAASSIVEIQPRGSLPRLFLVHGVGGGMFWGYTNLSKYLGPNQPVYGFKSRGLEGQEEFGTIEEMAEQYTRDLRAFQPHGPYYLGGYCFGGNVAYEMARQLKARGEEVALLALMNSNPTSEGKTDPPSRLVWMGRFLANLWYLVRCFFQRSPEGQRRVLLWQVRAVHRRLGRLLRRITGHASEIAADELVDLSAYPPDQRRLWESHIQSLVGHETQPYSGRVTLLRSAGHQFWCSFDFSYGWNGFAAGGTAIHIVPGAHEQILEEPHVRVLAQELKKCLHESLKPGAVVETRFDPRAPEPLRSGRRDAEIPLSMAQEGCWKLAQIKPEEALQNLPVAVRLKGRLDKNALQQALDELVKRHESLRATFSLAESRLTQKLQPPRPVQLFEIQVSKGRPANEILSLSAAEHTRRPFDFSGDLLLRAVLLSESETNTILVLVTHEIACDAFAASLLIQELLSLYEAFSQGRQSDLPNLEIQYADFACWQRRGLAGEIWKEHLDYWRQQLADRPSVLELAISRPRPSIPTFHAARQSIVISAALTKRLHSLSSGEDCGLLVALLGALQALLARYSGREEIVVAWLTSVRQSDPLKHLIGNLNNALVVPTSLSGDPTFTELLDRVSEALRQAVARVDLPIEKVFEEFPAKDLGSHPVFQVALSLERKIPDAGQIPGLNWSRIDLERTASRFDLHLDLAETGSAVEGWLYYRTDLFEDAAIQDLVGHWLTLLEGAAAHPEAHLSELPLLSSKERRRLLVEWNETRAPYPRGACVHHLFEKQAARSPDAVAVIWEREPITYRELNRQADNLAVHLRELGVGPEWRLD